MKTTQGQGLIDIYSVKSKLSPDQCDIAIAIWRKLGLFKLKSDSGHLDPRCREEVVWQHTFYNFDMSKFVDTNRMYTFTTQIINHYKTTVPRGWNNIDRINIKSKNYSYNIICKPSKKDLNRNFSRRVGTASTNIVTADRMQKTLLAQGDLATLPISALRKLVVQSIAKMPLEEREAWIEELVSISTEVLIDTKATNKLLAYEEDKNANNSDR